MRTLTPALLLLAACASTTPAPAPVDELGAPHPQAPAAIRTLGVPPLDPALIQKLREYQNVRSASLDDWCADGTSILIHTRFANTAQIHRVHGPGGRREQLTFAEDSIGDARWLPKSDHSAFLYEMSRGGDENTQIFHRDLEAGTTRCLTDGKARNTLGPLRHGGGQVVVSSTKRNGKDTDLYLVDLNEGGGERMLLQADGKFWAPVEWSPDDTKLLLINYVSVNESHPFILDVNTGENTAIPQPAKGAWKDAVWAPDGKGLYASCDLNGEFAQLVYVNLETQHYEWFTEEIAWDVEDIEIDPLGTRLAFLVNEDGLSKIYGLDLETRERTPIEIPMGVANDLKFSPDGNRLALSLNRPDHPADVYVHSFSDGMLTRWTFSEMGGLNAERFVRPELVRFPSFDGRTISAYFWKPKMDRPCPVVISIHGGPEGQHQPWFSSSTQFLATELGIAVIAPNVRGSTGYGKTFSTLDNGRLRENSVKDIGALLDWIATQPGLDRERVAVSGGSYGGYMVLASLVHFGERLRAGIDVVGISHFVTFLERTKSYRQDLRRVEYGDERDPEMRAHLESISPLNHVAKIRSALLVVHGKNDPRVPVSEAEQIVRAVQASGRPVWYVLAQDEGHGFAKKENSDFLGAAAMTFWETLLK